MSIRTMVLVVATVAFGAEAASAGRNPLAVSPGDPSGMALVEARCPTFSWAAVEGSESYELVVYRVEPQGADAEPVLEETLPAGVTSWTPSLDRCLERSGRYAWSVRAKGQDGLTEWSAAALFQVASGPSELEQILEIVQRYLDVEAAGAGRHETTALPAPEEELTAGGSATYPPGPNTALLVEDRHIAVRGDGTAFVQLDTSQVTPHGSYCDNLVDTGRMLVRVGASPRLYVCSIDGATPGWRRISLVP